MTITLKIIPGILQLRSELQDGESKKGLEMIAESKVQKYHDNVKQEPQPVLSEICMNLDVLRWPYPNEFHKCELVTTNL